MISLLITENQTNQI